MEGQPPPTAGPSEGNNPPKNTTAPPMMPAVPPFSVAAAPPVPEAMDISQQQQPDPSPAVRMVQPMMSDVPLATSTTAAAPAFAASFNNQGAPSFSMLSKSVVAPVAAKLPSTSEPMQVDEGVSSK
eukprot:scaffold14065_cov61-Skeletonema_dohrnii-CCMP3373.AAC.1